MHAVTRSEGRTGVVEAGSEISATTRRPLGRAIVVAAIVALLAIGGFIAGWLLRGGDEGSPPSYVVGGSVVAGDQLTDREREMVDVAQQYVAAFIANDGDAVASFMVPDGYLALPTLGDRVVRAADGSLQDWVERFGRIPNELNDPIAVHGHQVVLTGQFGDGLDWMMVIEFTDSGEVEIVSDTHWAD